MRIDARIQTVHRNADGSGKLCLIDRPPRKSDQNPGVAGQNSLTFNTSPSDVLALKGLDIWGGPSEIMLEDMRIAVRVGCDGISFIGCFRLNIALHEYRRRHSH